MGSLIDYLTERGLAERIAKPLAYLVIALIITGLLAVATIGYSAAVIRAEAIE